MNFHAVFWDLGGVAIRYCMDTAYLGLGKLFGVHPMNVVRFLNEGETPLWHKMDLGVYDKEEIREVFCKRFGADVSMDAFVRAFVCDGVMTLESGFLPLVEVLRHWGMKQFIVSNINHVHLEYVEKNFSEIFRFIPRQRWICSCKVKSMKKDSPHFSTIWPGSTGLISGARFSSMTVLQISAGLRKRAARASSTIFSTDFSPSSTGSRRF